METGYISNINEWVDVQEQKNISKKREFLFRANNANTSKLSSNGRSKLEQQNNFKLSKKLIDIFDQVVELLCENEEDFERIK